MPGHTWAVSDVGLMMELGEAQLVTPGAVCTSPGHFHLRHSRVRGCRGEGRAWQVLPGTRASPALLLRDGSISPRSNSLAFVFPTSPPLLLGLVRV